jgi:alpha-L-glutamate ligase-like protein
MATNIQDVLGMNARNYGYLSRYNKAKGKKIANSKLLTKSTLRKSKLPVPRLYRVFRSEEDVNKYDFTRLPESFVIKPNKGLGGEGIIVVEQGGTYAGQWITSQGETISIEDIKLHIGDILEGRFSIDDAPDFAFVEERIRIHPVFEKHAYHGTPDIRIIVFNRVPVMAMLRIPTRESGGRANLHQGAVGAGIDLATGITTYAIKYSKEVKFMPNTRRRVRGINIPEWDQVLELAVKCQEITKLGYLGADIVLQPSQKLA